MLVESCLPVMLIVFLCFRHQVVRANREQFTSNNAGISEPSGDLFDDFEPEVYDDDEFHYKRALDYGHFRFGKRAPHRPAAKRPTGDGQLSVDRRSPDYGHFKFGRRSPDYAHLKFGRRSPDYAHLKFGRRSPDYGSFRFGKRPATAPTGRS